MRLLLSSVMLDPLAMGGLLLLQGSLLSGTVQQIQQRNSSRWRRRHHHDHKVLQISTDVKFSLLSLIERDRLPRLARHCRRSRRRSFSRSRRCLRRNFRCHRAGRLRHDLVRRRDTRSLILTPVRPNQRTSHRHPNHQQYHGCRPQHDAFWFKFNERLRRPPPADISFRCPRQVQPSWSSTLLANDDGSRVPIFLPPRALVRVLLMFFDVVTARARATFGYL
uniref:(northern house mosquito) hypothetical protein n=1 Tax=Culex pipiens TaxID=7175 RepID=A0A8D8N9K7_CULPI